MTDDWMSPPLVAWGSAANRRDPSEDWQLRGLLEFHDALTRGRWIGEDLLGPGLGPTIVSIAEQPSFEANFERGFAWDIRGSGFTAEDLRLYVSEIDTRRADRLMPGYHEIAIDVTVLRAALAALASVETRRWFPADADELGVDGETYWLAMTRGRSRVQLRWWGDGPQEWRELATLVRSVVEQFKRVETPPSPIEIDPQRLRFHRRLPLEHRGQGVHGGIVPPWLLRRADVRLLLVVRCDNDDGFRRQLPRNLTIGPGTEIVGIASGALPGVPCKALSVIDDDLPSGAEAVCFELDRSTEGFAALSQSDGQTVVLVRDEAPSTTIELWAKRP